MRSGTLCSGIGAPEVAAPWIDWRWRSEIDRQANAVYEHHWPGVPNLGDMLAIDPAAVESVDLIVAGTPCQDFSVAGLRAGLAGERGNLTLRFVELLGELRPAWFVFENVPGLLSMDSGRAFASILDAIEELGYVCDIDILDAQFHGVPQRRRRVFICGQRAEDILKQRTLSSALTIAQCLAETLLLTLSVLSDHSIAGCENLGFDASDARHSLMRRIKLFSLHQTAPVAMSLDSLLVLHRWLECGQGGSESDHGKPLPGDSRSSEGTRSSASIGGTEHWRAECLSIAPSWSANLVAALRIANESITSTSASGTTDQKIFICAQALLSIAAPITQSMKSSPCFWSAASSALTALEAFTNYARQASSDLFGDVAGVRAWHDFLAEAEPTNDALGDIGIESFGQVLPLRQSLRRDSTPRRKAGKDVAGSLAASLGGSDENDAKDRRLIAVDYTNGLLGDIAGTLEAAQARGNRGHGVLATAHSLRADGFDASEDGTGRGTPLVFDERQITSKTNRSRVVPGRESHTLHASPPTIAFSCKDSGADAGDLAPTLRAMSHDKSHANAGGQVAVAFAQNTRDEVREMPLVGSLSANSGMKQTTYIRESTTVRRLTPREAERLMGLPDDFTRIPTRHYKQKPRTAHFHKYRYLYDPEVGGGWTRHMADGPRYKLIGNSLAVPVVGWILDRILLIHATLPPCSTPPSLRP